jgi:hypothetical protein
VKLPEFSIAANDPTLAHAIAYGRIKQLRGDTGKLFDQLQTMKGKTKVRDGAKMVETHFGKLILFSDVTRLKGSRPKARWLTLDANVDGGSDMVAVLVEVSSHGWDFLDLNVRLTSHLVARLMQRTTKHSSLQRSAEVLRFHIIAAMPLSKNLEGRSLTTANGSGALIWVPHEGGIRGMTWIGAETITDPRLAKICRDAGDSRVALHIKANGEPTWKERSAEVASGTMPISKQQNG